MVDVTWDIIKAGVTMVAGTYAMGMLLLVFIGISAIVFSAIIAGIMKLGEVIIDVAKHISNKRNTKQR